LTVRAEAPVINREVWTRTAKVEYEFPGTKRTTGKTIKLTWYDGAGHMPPRERLGLPEGAAIPQAGSVLLGEKGILLIPHVAQPRLYLKDGEAPLEKGTAHDHYLAWADACRGEGKTLSHFGYAGPLTEAVLLGAIAVRLPRTTLRWDAAALRITNSESANALVRKSYRKGWEPAWVS
jgi:hypothetical protein